jgi:type I restriction enzyme R subunit
MATNKIQNGWRLSIEAFRAGKQKRRCVYDNLGKDEALALAVDSAVRGSSQDDWRENFFKVRKVKFAIKDVLKDDEELTERVLELVKNQHEY